ncbi:MAG: hypothetical protein Q8O40_05520 [Chloroflexota bacterium]|nr:hypothetical protein [Chloroflexota bacterium]
MKLPGFVSGVRAFLRVEAVLLVALLAVGVAGLLLLQTVSRAEHKQATVEKRLAQARGELASVRLANEKGRLTAEMEGLKAPRAEGSNLSRHEALNMALAVVADVAQRRLRLITFSREDTLLTLGQTKQRAFGLSLELEGSIEDLLGLLGLIDGFPGPAVQSLELTRNATREGQWGAKVGVFIAYGEGP